MRRKLTEREGETLHSLFLTQVFSLYFKKIMIRYFFNHFILTIKCRCTEDVWSEERLVRILWQINPLSLFVAHQVPSLPIYLDLLSFPDRFDRDKQQQLLRDLSKKTLSHLSVHVVGFKDSASFVRARRTLTQLKTDVSDMWEPWNESESGREEDRFRLANTTFLGGSRWKVIHMVIWFQWCGILQWLAEWKEAGHGNCHICCQVQGGILYLFLEICVEPSRLLTWLSLDIMMWTTLFGWHWRGWSIIWGITQICWSCLQTVHYFRGTQWRLH